MTNPIPDPLWKLTCERNSTIIIPYATLVERSAMTSFKRYAKMKHLTFLLITYLFLINQSFADKKVGSVSDANSINELPKAWVEQQGSNVLLYAKYIESLGLKHITPDKVLHPHFKRRGSISNSIPPKHLWKNIAELLKVVDQLSANLDAEVKPFISAYRNPKYNKSVKGRPTSSSLKNMAVRVSFVGVNPVEVGFAARKLRSEGAFKGGVGVYSTSVHIDSRGTNADW